LILQTGLIKAHIHPSSVGPEIQMKARIHLLRKMIITGQAWASVVKWHSRE